MQALSEIFVGASLALPTPIDHYGGQLFGVHAPLARVVADRHGGERAAAAVGELGAATAEGLRLAPQCGYGDRESCGLVDVMIGVPQHRDPEELSPDGVCEKGRRSGRKV